MKNLLTQKIMIQKKLERARPFYEKALYNSLVRFFKDELILLILSWKVKKDKDSLVEIINTRKSKLENLMKSHCIVISRDFGSVSDFSHILNYQVERITKTTLNFLDEALRSKDPITGLNKAYNSQRTLHEDCKNRS